MSAEGRPYDACYRVLDEIEETFEKAVLRDVEKARTAAEKLSAVLNADQRWNLMALEQICSHAEFLVQKMEGKREYIRAILELPR